MGLAIVSQCTKFEVSRFTQYEAVNGGAKCRKWGGLGLLGVTHGHRISLRNIVSKFTNNISDDLTILRVNRT